MSDSTPIRVRLEQQEDFAFRLSFPDTDLAALLTDEPAPLGHDGGPNPSRLLLAAVANCLAASLLFALRKFRNDPSGPLLAEATALMQRNADGRWRLPRADVELHLPGNAASYPQLERILGQFEQFCVVTQSVRQGIDVAVTVKDVDGRVLLGDKSFEAGS
ncbi:MAG: OsmC family protein [Xanthomonadales bacterium]|nr:OsmC family protein [Xanthomonadales bacterium]